jgi:hypothetical protein
LFRTIENDQWLNEIPKEGLKENSELPTPNSELLRYVMDLPVESSLDQILSQLTLTGPPVLPRKMLFWGERAGEISSYVAGWLAGKEIEVIVLDGANRFDPYMISSFARKALIPPERLLKRIRIARAFTCYQMAIMVGERLYDLLRREGVPAQPENRWIILLGPVTPFMDEDVSEREVRPLFERSLKKIEEMAMKGVPFLLFQPSVFSNPPFPPFTKGGLGGLKDLKRAYLMKRLFQVSNLVWRISLEDQEPQMVLEKGVGLNIIENFKLQNEKCKFIREDLPYLSADRKIF